MENTEIRSPLLVGIKLGIQSIILTMCSSPIFIIVQLYVDALDRGSEHWSLSGLPAEIYCIGGPVLILLWFSLPYMLGQTLLSYSIRRLKDRTMTLLGSALYGMLAGMIGNWLMSKYFLISPWKGLYFSDWVLLGLMEIWSIAIFVWCGSRIYLDSPSS